MPRPPVKRRKPNHGFQLRSPRRLRIPDQTRAREDHDKNLANKPIGTRPADSDDSDELITTRLNSVKARKRQEIFASGAVGKGDNPGVFPSRAQRTRSMREDTEEILSQRSRSGSRANSETSDKERAAKQSAEHAFAPTSRARQVQVGKPMVNGIDTQNTEASVLGRIKPRKRQASILQLIDNNDQDTTSILSLDLSGFMPDEISTPHQNTVHSQIASQDRSLKRKRGADEEHEQTNVSTKASRLEDVLSPPSRAQSRKLAGQGLSTDEDFMAPPQSSDDENELAVPVKLLKRQPKAPAPTTQQLHSLLPSRRHQNRSSQSRLQNEFEIPPDFDETSEDERDISNFMPGTRSRKPSQRAKSKAATEATGRKTKHQKSTRNNPFSPSVVQIRTPRPLSVSKTRESQAKSPSQQDQVMQNKSTNTPVPTTQPAKMQYGGFRSRGTRAGKENEPVLLSNESSEADASRKLRGAARAWSKKWADIDDFSLEFVDVSPTTQSSSPGAAPP